MTNCLRASLLRHRLRRLQNQRLPQQANPRPPSPEFKYAWRKRNMLERRVQLASLI
jgi:hypothetical protein